MNPDRHTLRLICLAVMAVASCVFAVQASIASDPERRACLEAIANKKGHAAPTEVTSHAFGNSSNISGSVIVRCLSRRVGSLGRSSPLRGRPCWRLGRAALCAFGTGFSRPVTAVASREICPTRWSFRVRAISASCRRLASALSAPGRQSRVRTSPHSAVGKRRSSRTADRASGQPAAARSGRALSGCRTPPWQ